MRNRKWTIFLEADGSVIHMKAGTEFCAFQGDAPVVRYYQDDFTKRTCRGGWVSLQERLEHLRTVRKFCDEYVEEIKVKVYEPGTWFEQDLNEEAKEAIKSGVVQAPIKVEKLWM